jgi:hypothetical protein
MTWSGYGSSVGWLVGLSESHKRGQKSEQQQFVFFHCTFDLRGLVFLKVSSNGLGIAEGGDFFAQNFNRNTAVQILQKS